MRSLRSRIHAFMSSSDRQFVTDCRGHIGCKSGFCSWGVVSADFAGSVLPDLVWKPFLKKHLKSLDNLLRLADKYSTT